jgi:hypothetical protein
MAIFSSPDFDLRIHMGRARRLQALMVAALIASAGIAVAIAQESKGTSIISWQEAVGRVASERVRAETCARLLKRHAAQSSAALSRGLEAYSAAKAEMDGVIAGLIVVLAGDGEPGQLRALESQIAKAVGAREAFCIETMKHVPESEGTKNALIALVGAALGPLIDAIKEIYLHHEDADAQRRETIQTQLEAAKWDEFDTITP